MLALTSVWTTILLAAAVALGPLAIDMYLPALPAMGEALSANTGQVQLTLSIYMVGFALAQLVCGPLADRFGRKPIMIGGFLLFAIASVVCALATNIETLILCRFLQALGGSAGPVLGRAAVRDIYSPRDAAKIMAILASIMALAPAVAPTLGGFMVVSLGWSSIFLALGGYALIMAVVVAVGIPEPMRPENRQSLRVSSLWKNYRAIASDISFLGYTLTNSLTFAGLFAFLSGSSFVLLYWRQPHGHPPGPLVYARSDTGARPDDIGYRWRLNGRTGSLAGLQRMGSGAATSLVYGRCGHGPAPDHGRGPG